MASVPFHILHNLLFLVKHLLLEKNVHIVLSMIYKQISDFKMLALLNKFQEKSRVKKLVWSN